MALGGAVDTVSIVGVVFRVVVFAISILGVEFKVVYVAVGDVVGVDVVLERLLLLQHACLIQVRRKTSNVVHTLTLFCSNMLNVDRN